MRTALFWVVTQRVVVILYPSGNPLSTFRDNLSVPSSKNYHYTLRNSPEERSAQIQSTSHHPVHITPSHPTALSIVLTFCPYLRLDMPRCLPYSITNKLRQYSSLLFSHPANSPRPFITLIILGRSTSHATNYATYSNFPLLPQGPVFEYP